MCPGKSIKKEQISEWVFGKITYHKSSIRSRPCIISNPKFPRLVLEVFQNLQFLEQNFLSEAAHKGPNRVILKDLNFCQ